MPENYDLSDRNISGIEKSLAAKRVATPLVPIHLLSHPSPDILNYTEINPRFLICLRLIAHGRHECQGVIDAGDRMLDAGCWILDTG